MLTQVLCLLLAGTPHLSKIDPAYIEFHHTRPEPIDIQVGDLVTMVSFRDQRIDRIYSS